MDNGHLATPSRCLTYYNQDPDTNHATQVARVTFNQTTTLDIPVLNDSLPHHPSHVLLDLNQVNQRKANQALQHFAEQNGILTPATN